MEIINIVNNNWKSLVEKINFGAVLAYPTETCYGFGCDANNEEAVRKIFKIKKRVEEKSVLVIVDSLLKMSPYVEITPELEKINKKYWPGALTVIVKHKPNISFFEGVVKDGFIAFRVTSHPWARELCKQLSYPLVSTSANIAGEPNIYSSEEMRRVFLPEEWQPDILIDAGVLPNNPSSTIIKLEEGKIEVVREGSVKIKPEDIFD